jgi:hypothetical protein
MGRLLELGVRDGEADAVSRASGCDGAGGPERLHSRVAYPFRWTHRPRSLTAHR